MSIEQQVLNRQSVLLKRPIVAADIDQLVLALFKNAEKSRRTRKREFKALLRMVGWPL